MDDKQWLMDQVKGAQQKLTYHLERALRIVGGAVDTDTHAEIDDILPAAFELVVKRVVDQQTQIATLEQHLVNLQHQLVDHRRAWDAKHVHERSPLPLNDEQIRSVLKGRLGTSIGVTHDEFWDAKRDHADSWCSIVALCLMQMAVEYLEEEQE